MRDTVRGTCRVETTMKWTISASALILPLHLAWTPLTSTAVSPQPVSDPVKTHLHMSAH